MYMFCHCCPKSWLLCLLHYSACYLLLLSLYSLYMYALVKSTWPKRLWPQFVCVEGKIPPDEPATLPPLPIKDEKRRSGHYTPQVKRLREREWERERDVDIELMPPPGSHKKSLPVSVDADQPIDPNEPTYCVCHQVFYQLPQIFSLH